jgi:hypothetical protein
MALFAIKEAIIPHFYPARRGAQPAGPTHWNGRSWTTEAECFGRATDFLFGGYRHDTRFMAEHPESVGTTKVYTVTGDPTHIYKFTLVSE